jgi:uncharacterized protein (TIGR00369 family)
MGVKDRSTGVAMHQDVAALSGIEILREMIAGRLPAPPIGHWLDFGLVEVEEGRAVFEGRPNPNFLNPLGTIHGGWALTLIDSATGCAAHTLLPPGAGYTTVETRSNFNRPILPDTGLVRAEGTVIARGRRIITAEARVTDASGRLLAHGGSTLMVL